MEIEHFEHQARRPAVAGGKEHSLPLWRLDNIPIHFSCKKGPIPALIKKVLCVTREQLTFSDSDDDFEHSCITRAPS